MDKFNKILKNVVVFLVVFITIQYIFQSCQNPEEAIVSNDGNIVFLTTKDSYSRQKTVEVKVENTTGQTITIPNECPQEPFNVFKYENNEWIPRTVSPILNCENAKDIVIEPGEEVRISYDSWNYALFSDMGRFKIEFDAQIGEEIKTIPSNEFIVKKEGIIGQLWNAIFYRPIYNGLIFLASVLPLHDLGFAIILLTLIIRTILLIPNQKAMMSQKKLQEIQPRLNKVKEKYKGDQQKIAMETMSIWKEAKINPFGSCLPMLMQFPFLIALFYVIKSGLNPDNTYLLYSQYQNFSIADINVNFLGILDLTKINIYVLPVLIGALQFIQIKLSMARKPKKNKQDNQMAAATGMMAYIMPVMIAVFTASLPAGVGLYWGTSTGYGIIQQLFVNKSKGPKGEKEPTVKVITKD